MLCKRYLGDGVYAEQEDNNIVLTVSDGEQTTEIIVLEPWTIKALVEYHEEVIKDITHRS